MNQSEYEKARRSRERQEKRAEREKAKRARMAAAKAISKAKKEPGQKRVKRPGKSYYEGDPNLVYQPKMGNEFYRTGEWRRLRFMVLSTSKGCCNICGRSYKKHGIVLHVDHIKPRSKYPDLELEITNLQVLCEDCNLGKGANPQIF